MVYSIETLPEESWTQAEALLLGKQPGHRVLVWVNYDILSLCKTFFLLEKSVGRISVKDFPLPVFWDEETPLSSNRLARLQHAIDSYSFDDLPSYTVVEEDDTWGDSEWNELERSESQKDSEEEYEIPDTEEQNDSDFEEDEKEEIPEEYLKRQFEMYLKDVAEEYQPMARQTFQQHIESLVEKLKMNAGR